MNAIYPHIELRRVGDKIIISTTLRKQHKGRWYLWKFNRLFYEVKPDDDVIPLINQFNIDVYLAILTGNINPHLISPDWNRGGQILPIFPLDNDQVDELDRLAELFPDKFRPISKSRTMLHKIITLIKGMF